MFGKIYFEKVQNLFSSNPDAIPPKDSGMYVTIRITKNFTNTTDGSNQHQLNEALQSRGYKRDTDRNWFFANNLSIATRGKVEFDDDGFSQEILVPIKQI